MDSASRNVAAVPHAKCLRFSPASQCHLAIKNDVRRKAGVCVVRIKCIGAILPDIHVCEPLRHQLLPKLAFIQGSHVFRNDYSSRDFVAKEGELAGGRVFGDPPASIALLRGKLVL
jgi:hypothetical protein